MARETSAPSILGQPATQTLVEGESVVLSVVANGTAPFFYQWKKNDVPIPGATASSLAINAAQLTDAGAYSVVVSNAFGNVTSLTATLVITASAYWPIRAVLRNDGSLRRKLWRGIGA